MILWSAIRLFKGQIHVTWLLNSMDLFPYVLWDINFLFSTYQNTKWSLGSFPAHLYACKAEEIKLYET